MTRKMLIKVTVDEALFPELYQRLEEFENTRLRAAVLRSLASDRVRFPASAVPEAPAPDATPALRLADRPLTKPEAPTTTPVSPRPIVATVEQYSVDTAQPDAMSELSHRFNVDEIADQFAGF
jgi:hypothetical protein